MDITRWPIPKSCCSRSWRSSIQSAETRPGADCVGSDHKLFIATFRFKLKKIGKTPRPLRYDLNQIPYDYTVEVTNQSKGLDLIDREPEELCILYGHCSWHCTGCSDQDHPQEKEMQKGKQLPKEASQIAENRREVKGKGEKERYTHLNTEFQRIARRDKKEFLSDQCKEIEENNTMGKTEILSRKLVIPWEYFMKRLAQ